MKVKLQARPSEERNSEAPLGYLGRTALRKEQCNVVDKALLGNDNNGRLATVAKQWLSTQVTRVESKMFSVWSVRRLYNRVTTE
jgi:hypothetical protein